MKALVRHHAQPPPPAQRYNDTMPAERTLAQLALLVLLVLILGLLGMWVAWMCLRTWRRTHTHNHSKTTRRRGSDIWRASGHRLEKKFNKGKNDRQDDPPR